jgi:two-component system chemotaxis response regulator CheB
MMTEIINSQGDMTVVGTAADPLVARDLIKVTNPDVLTLDVEMPRMDGLEFLEKLMRLRPMPVVMVSSLTERGSEIALRALELGAIDFVTKPRLGVRDGLAQLHRTDRRQDSHGRQRAHASPAAMPAPVRPGRRGRCAAGIAVAQPAAEHREADHHRRLHRRHRSHSREVLQPLPPDSPAVLIAQHMPAGFTQARSRSGSIRLCAHPREGGRARRARAARPRLHRARWLSPVARRAAAPTMWRTSTRSRR